VIGKGPLASIFDFWNIPDSLISSRFDRVKKASGKN